MKRSQSGFTLVELAIALMIIGLLIGAVLKGQELVENARVTKMMTQMKSYQTAASAFYSNYNEVPGDMTNAASRIPSCTTTTYCSGKGDGDGHVGYLATSRKTAPWTNDEQWAFWQQLGRAGLITGLTLAEIPPDNTPGSTLPGSPMGTITYVATFLEYDSGGTGWNTWLWFLLPTGNASSPDNGTVTTAFTPMQLSQIDTKMDDSKSNTGEVQAYVGSAVGCTLASDYTSYTANDNTTQTCNLMYKIHF